MQLAAALCQQCILNKPAGIIWEEKTITGVLIGFIHRQNAN